MRKSTVHMCFESWGLSRIIGISTVPYVEQSSRMRELQGLVFDMLLLPSCSYWNITNRNTSTLVYVFKNGVTLLLKFFLRSWVDFCFWLVSSAWYSPVASLSPAVRLPISCSRGCTDLVIALICSWRLVLYPVVSFTMKVHGCSWMLANKMSYLCQ